MDGRLAAPCLFEGTCDTAVFNAWLKTRLCPRLNAQHLVIMDNAALHTSPETAPLIEATGATLLFLAPYSPDLNPIEQDFAALKKRREYQEQATLDDIVKTYHPKNGSPRIKSPQFLMSAGPEGLLWGA